MVQGDRQLFGYTREVECCAYEGRGNVHILGDGAGDYMATVVEAIRWVSEHSQDFGCPLRVSEVVVV